MTKKDLELIDYANETETEEARKKFMILRCICIILRNITQVSSKLYKIKSAKYYINI